MALVGSFKWCFQSRVTGDPVGNDDFQRSPSTSSTLCSSSTPRRSVEMIHNSIILTSVQVGHVSYYLLNVFQPHIPNGDVRFLNQQQYQQFITPWKTNMEPEHTPLGKGETSINQQILVFQPFVFWRVIRLQEIQCIRCIALSCHCIQQGCEAKAIHATQLGRERPQSRQNKNTADLRDTPKRPKQKDSPGSILIHVVTSWDLCASTPIKTKLLTLILMASKFGITLFRADSKHHLFQFQNHLRK